MDRHGRNKTRKMSGSLRKHSIIRSAERLFSRRGFRGTTTKEIAKKAGISEATIFRYFRGKSELYSEIINRHCNTQDGSLLLSKRLNGKEGKEAFKEAAEFFMERYRVDPSFARLLMFSALERQRFSEIFIKSKGMETLDLISGIIKERIKNGSFRKGLDPELSARAFLGMVLHYCISQEIFGFKRYFPHPQARVVDTFVDVFLNGMAKRGR